MAEQAQMLINWTPSSDAVSQEVHRSLSSSGPWTVIATVGAAVSSYTDTTVDPTPFTTYYYKIKTICADGSSDSIPNSDVCQNCAEGQGNPSLFIVKNNITNDNVNEVTFTYEHAGRDWWNTTYGTSLATSQSIGVGRTPFTGVDKAVICHTCGEGITFQLSSFAQAGGATQLDAEYTHASDQTGESFLPASAFGFTASPLNRDWKFDSTNNTSLSHLDAPGYFWLGSQTNNSIKATNFNAQTIPTNFNIGELQVNQIRISKTSTPVNGTSTNHSSAFASFASNSSDDHYMFVKFDGFSGPCLFWLFKVVRATGLDITNSSGAVQMYGYTIDYINGFEYDGYKFVCSTDTTVYGDLLSSFNNGFVIKFFTSNDINF